MSKVNVKNGTPVGNTHLCDSCHWGQFITGYRESDRLVDLHQLTEPRNIAMPFTVYECTEYFRRQTQPSELGRDEEARSRHPSGQSLSENRD